MDHVAGVMHGNRLGDRLEQGAKAVAKPPVGEEFVHIQNGCAEAVVAIQDLAVRLHRVTATGGGHQYGVELSFDRIHAFNKG